MVWNRHSSGFQDIIDSSEVTFREVGEERKAHDLVVSAFVRF